MRIILFYLFIYFLISIGCERETIFDENITIDRTLKKLITEYLHDIEKSKNTVISIKKRLKNDTLEYIIKDYRCLAHFVHDSVSYRMNFMNRYIYSNYENSSFYEYSNLEKIAKSLNDIKSYDYFKKTKRILYPYVDDGCIYLEILFFKGKFVKKEYKATEGLLEVKINNKLE
jgi:hypothetical protein